MKKRDKGMKYIREAMGRHQSHDWLCSKSVLECADYLAVREDCKIHFVKVTTLSAKELMTKFDDVPFNLNHCCLIVLVRLRGGGFRIWFKNTLGWAEVGKIDDILG